MGECHVENKKPTEGAIELFLGGSRRLINGPHGDVEFHQQNLQSNATSCNSSHVNGERGEGNSYQGGRFSHERNRPGNGTVGIVNAGNDGSNGRVNGMADYPGSNSVNQNSGLYIGGGKLGGPTNGSHRPTAGPSVVANGNADTVEISPQVGSANFNTAGPTKSTKSSESALSALGSLNAPEGSSNGGFRVAGSLKVGSGGGHVETMSSSGSSNGGSPAQDVCKGSKAQLESNTLGKGVSTAGNNVRGIGNIVGRGGAVNLKSSSSSQGPSVTSRGGSSTPRNSGEFSNGNVMGSSITTNRGTSTPRHSGEFSMGANGHCSSSSTSSPRTSGELGNTSGNTITKTSTNCLPKSSPDSSNGSSKGGTAPRTSFEGNIIGGRINTGTNAAKGGRSMAGSPPRSNLTSKPNMGNLRKGNWNGGGVNGVSSTGNGKSNGRMDCMIGNILNSNHGPTCANGNILNSGKLSNGKGLGKSDASKSGVDVAGSETVDSVSESILMKRGFCSSNPEEVKNIGNELYRKGSFAEALSLYERAISLSPGHASYRSNKAAALSGLGRLPEAVHECEEAIKLEPFYVRAHQRAASLYLRLGLVESAKRHFQAAGQQSNLGEFQRVEQVKKHISKCIEMRKAANWNSVIRESDAAVVSGADSAPQVFGYKAEALLKLQRPEEADVVLSTAQKLEGALTKLGVTPADSFLFVVRAHVDMALGRFEEAVMAAEMAVRVDPRKVEITNILRKARAVCFARSSGNELFKAGKFFEACAAYGEGLESDPMNAVLLCNRAACRSKIGQWEKAVEDCNAALAVQPNYTKALMRRADCNAKLERWEDALNDYEALLKEIPGDRDVARGLFEAQVALKKSQGEEIYKMKFGGDMKEVSNKDQFREAVTFPGLVIVQFIARWNDRCREISPFMDGLCKRYPSVNFVKVDVEENPYLGKAENVDFVPTFKIYKNGMKMKEIVGPNQQALEYAVQQFFV